MKRKHISKDKLIHGFYYKGQCRNATVARWNGEKQKFIHFRTKFGEVFLEEICCPEDDQVWDVFYAEEVIEPQDVAKEISFEKYDNWHNKFQGVV